MNAGQRGAPWLDLIAICVCTLAWGTTWFAITLQFGVVDPVVSVVYRFALAALLLFAWCAVRRAPLRLTRAQHAAALGVGIATFAVNYVLVYWAEQRVASAVVAVLFASMAFCNLVGFRLAFGQRAARAAWLAAGLGIVGVAILSWREIASASFGARAALGIALALGAIAASVIGNIFARRGELAGAPVAAFTGWAMAYGVAVVSAFALAAGKAWTFDWSWRYGLSLLHLAISGSVIAFLLYYGLARRRGYGVASYIAALLPPIAMLMSTLFEGKTWSAVALAGVALVLSGQVLLLRVRRA